MSGSSSESEKFDRPKTAPCPDCNIENRLSVDTSTPRRIGRVPFRPTKMSSWRPLASAGCETCDGNGAVRLTDYERIDPYSLNARESRDALERVKLQRIRGGKDSSFATFSA